MPEGPTILMLREEVDRFRGKTVREVSGTAKLDLARLQGKRVKTVRTWGKHLLLEFGGFTVRIHLLLFGSYRIDDPKNSRPTLSLAFDNGELAFYASSVKFIEGDLDEAYDWTADVLSDQWSVKNALKKIGDIPETLVCDVLLDQEIFAGVGNIIKNEVLFRMRIHPESRVGALSIAKTRTMINDASAFSFQFLEWRRAGVLKKNCRVHNKSRCPDCGKELDVRILGKTRRRAFYCSNCQIRYPREK
jgi:endonuclease-8